jgi:DNA modification methylase
MISTHTVLFADSRNLASIKPETVDLVITSPPYPMIQMWDSLFSSLSSDIKNALNSKKGSESFELMHLELDKVWAEMFRVLKNGSFLCINIGDAVRTISQRFSLYPNHARIIACCQKLGFDPLPVLLWRKQTNAPNKFMGSGMLPAGAYVTLEHEYILIFRKGGKREFLKPAEKSARMESALFWEERNIWFSDIWDFKGTRQNLANEAIRDRSAAYPFELVYRLINMYSLYNDTILDPFLGTGTSSLAAIASGRNSIGVELDPSFRNHIKQRIDSFIPGASKHTAGRITSHLQFIKEHSEKKGVPKYVNKKHEFPVITKQETELQLYQISGKMEKSNDQICIEYNHFGKFDITPHNTIVFTPPTL